MRSVKYTAIFSALLISNIAFSMPTDGQVAAGSANISQSGTTTTINQTSPSAVINWHGFDTANNEAVNFNQPGANSVVLNRITSGQPTNFAGSLSANGRVFIVNPAGMVFAKGSRIDASGFLATTADIKDEDFMKGDYKFLSHVGSEDASIINDGIIQAYTRGLFAEKAKSYFISLIAPNVINNGEVYAASSGTVVLASGKTFVLDFNQDNLINFDASSIVRNGHVENNGEVSTFGGKVFMTTNAVSHVLDSMINTAGVTEANTIMKKMGKNNEVVILGEKDSKAGTITAGCITAYKVMLKADHGIIINKNIQDFVPGEHGGYAASSAITAKTMTGNISVNGDIQGLSVALSAENGAITESRSSTIWAKNLNTVSSTGTTLSGKNKIWNFTAENTASNGIYLRNYGEPVTTLGETSGDYKLETIGFWDYYFGRND